MALSPCILSALLALTLFVAAFALLPALFVILLLLTRILIGLTALLRVAGALLVLLTLLATLPAALILLCHFLVPLDRTHPVRSFNLPRAIGVPTNHVDGNQAAFRPFAVRR